MFRSPLFIVLFYVFIESLNGGLGSRASNILRRRRNDDSSCRTHDNKDGECKPIHDCPKVLSNIRNEYPNICRWIKLEPVVCCPIENVPDLKVFGCGIRFNKSSILIRRRRSLIKVVYGGVVVEPYSWPWMVRLEATYGSKRRYICGASFISAQYLISAAHCFYLKLAASRYRIRFKAHTENEGTLYRVQQIKIHEKYFSNEEYYDIALIKLVRPITGVGFFTVCLPSPALHRTNLSNKSVIVLGWGDLEFGGKRSKVLRKAQLNIVSNSVCKNAYSNITFSRLPRGIVSEQLCAAESGGKKDACQLPFLIGRFRRSPFTER
ncbi:clotting factor B-like isoform X2 [Tachypleus tridentatus]|uniref:clotting factor B-like isoform X2 n=1 Tax=Tachypleus tridentatus TaxID=6853 RepID=UPI003FD06016